MPGVKTVEVDYEHATATITFEEPATAESLKALQEGVKAPYGIQGVHGHGHK